MDACKVKRTEQAPVYSVHAVSGSQGRTTDSFQQHLGNQRKEHFKNRVMSLFDEITDQADSIVDNVDLLKFENYRGLIRDLLNEVVKNAYILNSERVMDQSGMRRIYSTIHIIDKKLECIAADILNRNSERIEYISRVDEIRGLVMDNLL